ncbi:condensation domain-containing protein [Ottowia testudinis]|uniref:AMP-binding protein n=1 Tax=Ottowia testudinis TaxID=2816950 RepID=A0A975CEY9_9BURK|nr:condensation domain-containing protein [Ottowia testudinis]QTD43582.1 AMP-binding protein [Ottowia testudinis]
MTNAMEVDWLAAVQALVQVPLHGRDDDNLIELGLDSLHIMRLVNLWRRAGATVTFAQLIERPTLRNWRGMLGAGPISAAMPGGAAPPLPVADRPHTGQPFGLTDVQHAYWIGRQDGQPLGGVGCHAYLEIDGRGVCPERLEAAWRLLFERHGMLRARFTEAGAQIISDDIVFPALVVHDLRSLPVEEAGAHLRAVRERLSHRRLDVEAGQVAGLELSLRPHGETRVHFDIDLLVADVQSLQILLRDLAAAYTGGAVPADPMWCFSRYLTLEHERDRAQRETAREHWRARLPQLPGGPQLPLIKDPVLVERPRFARRQHRLAAASWQALRGFAAVGQVTPAMVLVSAYAEILARWSAEPHFVLNLPLFDRKTDHPGIEHVVADFTNLLLLQCDCRVRGSFLERARNIQKQFHLDVAHAAYSAVNVQRDLVKEGAAQGVAAPVVFACNLGTQLLTGACKAALGNLNYMVSQTPQVWLDHQVYEDDDGLLLAWDAVEELFPAGLLDDMFRAYFGLLEWLAEDAAHWRQPVSIALLAHQAKAREAANRTQALRRAHCLHDGLFEVAARSPRRTALLAGDAAVSYGELAERALRVAALLQRHGVVAGEPVAVSLPRGVEQVVAVFGVLAAGGCYVPVGVHQPAARQAKIHAAADIRWVLTDAQHLNDETRDGTRRLDVMAAQEYPR